MKKNEFAEIFKDFAYGFTESKLLEEGTVATWYKYLKDFSSEDFRTAVDIILVNESRRPSLSELISKCKTLQNRRKHGTELK